LIIDRRSRALLITFDNIYRVIEYTARLTRSWNFFGRIECFFDRVWALWIDKRSSPLIEYLALLLEHRTLWTGTVGLF